jgi:hypothetical protein
VIVGLCGLKNSGKDTVAAHLVKNYGYERRAFADPLKKSVANLFDIPFSEVDKMKNDESYRVTISLGDEHSVQTVTPNTNISWRSFLQRYGTEAHRDVPEMGDDFWVDLTLPVPGFYVGRDIVISDLRFKSEAKRIRQLEGLIVEVSRPHLVNQDQHRSEQEFKDLDIDYTIFNNGTHDDLKVSVEIMVEAVNKISAYYGT